MMSPTNIDDNQHLAPHTVGLEMQYTSSHLMNFSPAIMEGGTETCFS